MSDFAHNTSLIYVKNTWNGMVCRTIRVSHTKQAVAMAPMIMTVSLMCRLNLSVKFATMIPQTAVTPVERAPMNPHWVSSTPLQGKKQVK